MSRTKGTLIALTVMLLGVSSASAIDIDLTKIKVDGAFDIKGLSANNETDFMDSGANDGRSVTRHRLSLGVGGDIMEKVNVRVEAVRRPLTGSPVLGATGGQFGQTNPGAAPANVGQTGINEMGNLTIENAYVSMEDVIWGINAKLGRMYWGMKDSLVGYAGHYGDDNMTTMGVDGITLHHKCHEAIDVNISALTTKDYKALGGTDYTGVAAYVTSRMTYKSIGATSNLKDLMKNDKLDIPVGVTVHSASDQGAATASDNVNMGIYELNVGANLMNNMLKLGLDWGSNYGQRNVAGPAGTAAAKVKLKGSLVAVRGAWSHEEKGFGVSAEIANASGDGDTSEPDGTAAQISANDKSWHDLSAFGLMPYKHYGEILGRSNVLATGSLWGLDGGSPLAAGAAGQSRGFNVMKIGASYNPKYMDKKWMFGLDYITAEASKLRPTAATAVTGLTATATDATTLTKDIGTEIDLSASYMKSENMMFKVGYAEFDPESMSAVLGTGAITDKVTKYFANASVRF